MKKNSKGGYLDKEINISIPIKNSIINVEKEDNNKRKRKWL